MAQLPRSGVLKGFGGSTINLRAQLWLVPEFESKIRRNIIVDGYFKSFLTKVIGDLSYFFILYGYYCCSFNLMSHEKVWKH